MSEVTVEQFAEVLKVPHHGSADFSPRMLEAVKPVLSVISSGDESVATAAPAADHRARTRGADMRFVVMPGRGSGFYRMAGLELAIPTYHRLGGAIEF